VLGFYREEKLVGMAGIYRVAKVKSRHKAHVWGMYVRPAYRAKGVGTALLRAVIEQAGRWPGVTQIHLSVTEAAPAARRLYERSGFQEWGNEPSGLCWEGHCVDERHMVLRLGSAPQARVGG
jgi:GNAT superfamily N-acetyltransferase